MISGTDVGSSRARIKRQSAPPRAAVKLITSAGGGNEKWGVWSG
jgi:hypothetical protein